MVCPGRQKQQLFLGLWAGEQLRPLGSGQSLACLGQVDSRPATQAHPRGRISPATCSLLPIPSTPMAATPSDEGTRPMLPPPHPACPTPVYSTVSIFCTRLRRQSVGIGWRNTALWWHILVSFLFLLRTWYFLGMI